MTAVPLSVDDVVVSRARIRPLGLTVGVVALIGATMLGLSAGAVAISPWRAMLEVLDHLPGVDIDSGLSDRHAAIIWKIRMPRVALGLIVGAMLSMSGAAYQGVFRNPLADPHLLGVSSGAGLGATVAIVAGVREIGPVDAIPLAAFVGAMLGIFLTYVLASIGSSSRSAAVLILAGIAVAAFLSAIQTLLLQQNADSITEVYTWLLGRLSTSGWTEIETLVPYAVVTTSILVVSRRLLDVMAVGDDEASTLGLNVNLARAVIVLTASLAIAAAVSVSGIIGFVGVVVPHTVRLIVGSSYRVILPLSLLFGGAFLVLADLTARTVLSPAEVPVGVVTAFLGAPFFAVILRSRKVVSV